MTMRWFNRLRSGLIAMLIGGLSATLAMGQDGPRPGDVPSPRLPGQGSGPGALGSAPDASMLGESVGLLQARDAGTLAVEAQGAGDSKVVLHLKNQSPNRLHVVLPPGLVAASATGQFQSMGLGLPTNAPEAFGRFQDPKASTTSVGPSGGFRSLPLQASKDRADQGTKLTIPAGQQIQVNLPAVCLNFGVPEPQPSHRFELMDVGRFSPNPRVRQALRSLSILGTSRRVAQVVMWHVNSGLSLPEIARRSPETANRWELAIADYLVQALRATPTNQPIIDPASIRQDRVLVRIQGDPGMTDAARRLRRQIGNQTLFGLPVQLVQDQQVPSAAGPAVYLVVTLQSSDDQQTVGRVAVHGMARAGEWINGGVAKLRADVPASELDGAQLAQAINESVAQQFVTVQRLSRDEAGTWFRIDNRLPLTIAHLKLDASKTESVEAIVDQRALGIGPLRSGQVVIQADQAQPHRVTFNGL